MGLPVASGDIDPGARGRAAEAHEFLLRVRHALHYARERRFDRLSRERQESVAAALGYAHGRALMTDYFAHAEWIHAGAVRVGERLRRRTLPLVDGLVVEDGEIDTADRARPGRTWQASWRSSARVRCMGCRCAPNWASESRRRPATYLQSRRGTLPDGSSWRCFEMPPG